MILQKKASKRSTSSQRPFKKNHNKKAIDEVYYIGLFSEIWKLMKEK